MAITAADRSATRRHEAGLNEKTAASAGAATRDHPCERDRHRCPRGAIAHAAARHNVPNRSGLRTPRTDNRNAPNDSTNPTCQADDHRSHDEQRRQEQQAMRPAFGSRLVRLHDVSV